MPLGRYFLYVGGALLALLLVAGWYWPAEAPEIEHHHAIDRTTLHILSDQKWPERIQFDTSATMPAPPARAPDMLAAAPPPPGPRSARDAFAQVQPEQRKAAARRKVAAHRRRYEPQAPLRFAVNPTPQPFAFGW